MIIFQFDEATKLVILEIYADKNQIKRAFDDKLAYKGIGVFLHETCCGYSLELPWRGYSNENNQLYFIE